MSNEEFIETVISQLRDYVDGKPTDRILLLNNLILLGSKIQKSAEFKFQIN